MKEVYTDFSLVSAKYFLKFSGVWLTTNRSEELQKRISLLYVAVGHVYGIWVNVSSIYHQWNRDISYALYNCNNMLCIMLSLLKVATVHHYRYDLAEIVNHARQHFWHYDYDPEEMLIFSDCKMFCKIWISSVYCIAIGSVAGFALTPLLVSNNNNNSDRPMPIKLWTDFPVNETPYYELLVTFQVLCVFVIGIAYLSTDTFLTILNMHVIVQFRILQYRMLRLWEHGKEKTDMIQYNDRCFSSLKKCVQQHQSLAEFCGKLERVFSFTILWHIVIFSMVMGLDSYQILLPGVPSARRIVFVFYIFGSFAHLVTFSYGCHGLSYESSKVCTTMYFGSWGSLPMNKTGRLLRSSIRIIMVRSLRPCCLTAGGFFPVSLETATTLFSSTVSYFTLMRESLMKIDN